jgi:hypothetical protein
VTDSEPHSTNRMVGAITKGYHVLVDGAWLRVDGVARQKRGKTVLVTPSGSVERGSGTSIVSRSPAEQFYAVSALLPTVQRVKLRGPITNPFCGSAPSPIAPPAFLRVYAT